jgi:hypothetical protein
MSWTIARSSFPPEKIRVFLLSKLRQKMLLKCCFSITCGSHLSKILFSTFHSSTLRSSPPENPKFPSKFRHVHRPPAPSLDHQILILHSTQLKFTICSTSPIDFFVFTVHMNKTCHDDHQTSKYSSKRTQNSARESIKSRQLSSSIICELKINFVVEDKKIHIIARRCTSERI